MLKPYEISCTLESVENGDDIHNVIVLVDVKQQKKYCFSLYDRTCRMTVLPDEKCEIYA